ncbi:hypothetical protein B0I37DRAFT_240335 [Chaetomium sp. MPI-CAGE-AT-0009]|nr:hypothetical protein B0I37DRAFT_240335 [Chaetomium sp. MPI-CAGE-AT-0009]
MEISQRGRDIAISGPQETEEQWTQTMWRCIELRVEESRIEPSQRDLVSQLGVDYHTIFKGHKSVFTHACLYPSEMILREDGVVVLMDWAHSGWYPSYWEYSTARYFERRWGDEISLILNEFIPEQSLMRKHMDIILDDWREPSRLFGGGCS